MSGIAAAASFFKSTIGMEHSPDTRNEYKGGKNHLQPYLGKMLFLKKCSVREACWEFIIYISVFFVGVTY